MNPLNWSTLQWIGFSSAAIGLIGAGAWWEELMSPHHVAIAQSGILTVSGLIHLLGQSNA